jgi:4-amino-4-deoxy-L-arabinose transferase-like glycosyltransferase
MFRIQVGGSMLAFLMLLWAVALLPGLGSASRLTYHEALVAQGSREMLARGDWSYPTVGGLPWLEKPPLPWWLAAALGRWTGGVTETVARLPSAFAALGLVVAVAMLAARHHGRNVGFLAGAIQATTAWTVIRGRLAEADILLACLVTWSILAFDRIRNTSGLIDRRTDAGPLPQPWRAARWAFFTLLGLSGLVKAVGFGPVLIGLVALTVLVWERDRNTVRCLWLPAGWALAGVLALAWPVLMAVQHGPEAIGLWATHIAGRVLRQQGHGPFASEPWPEYLTSILAQALPWAPLAFLGAWRSLGRAIRGWSHAATAGDRSPTAAGASDRLLWAWSATPLVLLSLAAVRNAHYAVCAQVPWSIWAALELVQLARRLRQRGWDSARLRRTMRWSFSALAFGYGVGFWLLGPWFDRRGVEWAFYETVGRQVPPESPLALLYDDWDRDAYDGAFGVLPHDLAVRLFYLGRTACWHASTISLNSHRHAEGVGEDSSDRWHLGGEDKRVGVAVDRGPSAVECMVSPAVAVIGRDRDLPGLARLGRIEIVARGPALRRDRTYTLFRLVLDEPTVSPSDPIAGLGVMDQTLKR